jgi:hypothetical protein
LIVNAPLLDVILVIALPVFVPVVRADEAKSVVALESPLAHNN